jgi:hypothetical protein
MTFPARSRFADILRAAAPLAVIATAAAVLLRFPPNHNSFYPRCPIYETLHLQCPGCGATRALAAVLRGHFSEAMHSNALVTLLLPIAAVYSILWYRRLLRGEAIRWPQPPQAAIYCAFGVAAIFTLLRNLPLSR